MIESVSDFLFELKNKEQELLKQYDIVKHPGIIGDMYEGLTKDILSKSIFKGLDVRIVAGKIRNSKNKFSGEIDCMVVHGGGEQIPYTDKYIYDSSQVIGVIQVKKNLFTQDLKDSYENLRTVIDVTEARDGEPYHGRLLRDAWRLICKEEVPRREYLGKLPIQKEMLYHILLMEAFLPARIVWGYNGFKSEFSLRESFIKYLEGNVPLNPENPTRTVKGFGPLNFPNLVICDKYSLIKTNGIPYGYPIDKDNWWSFFVSSYENPVYFLLEIIWTRLHYKFGISSQIFGEDLKVETMHGYLLGRYKEIEALRGWEYFYIPTEKELLEEPLDHKDWEPTFLDHAQFVVINELCRHEAIEINKDEQLKQFLNSNGYTIDSLTASLKETGLVDTKEGILSLITVSCVCGITSDGKYFAGDNKSGRVSRWMVKNDAKKRT